MSVRVMSLVWDSTVPAPERFTLLALGDRADEEGVCWPSRATLARKCRTSETTIRRHLKTLEAMGVLHIHERRIDNRHSDSNRYRIDLAVLRGLVDDDQPAPPKTPLQSEPTPLQSEPPSNLNPGSNLNLPRAQSEPRGGSKLTGRGVQSGPQYISDSSVDPSVIRQGARERAPKPRATRIPEDFTVTPAMVAWAQANVPHVDGRRETENFVDYWRAAAGANARKLDWIAAWRTWMRRADTGPTAPALRAVNGGRSSSPRVPTTTQRVNDALAFLRPGED